ncbi:MAG: relaxase [Pseudomonadota bacterium]
MILKGAQRSGAKALANHLSNETDNDFVELHQVRGFLSEEMTGAFKEVQAIAKGTRCKQPFFSVSLNPPNDVSVSIELFEATIDKIEKAHGLVGQPRVIVFHEKDGRRHAHAVWSRIDAETMTARNLPHFKNKLQAISRALFIEHQWKMPRGLIDRSQSNPTNVTLAEWQAAKRRGRNAIDQKALIQQCWAASDDRASFATALSERGYLLAQGTRRSHVIVAHDGEVFAVARATGHKAKDVRARLGDPNDLPSVDEAKERHRADLGAQFGRLAREARRGLSADRARLDATRATMITEHRRERAVLDAGQADRWKAEATERAAQLRKGLSGWWQRLTGERSRIIAKNEAAALSALSRDREQRQRMIDAQLAERRQLEAARTQLRREALGLVQDLRTDRDRLVEKLQAPHVLAARRRRPRREVPEQAHGPGISPEP